MRLQWDSRFFRGGAVWFERDVEDAEDEDGELVVLDSGDLTVAGCAGGCSGDCEPAEEQDMSIGFRRTARA